jgi:hypothetical protein
VVDIIKKSMEAAVNSVVADISKAYEPQMLQQAELIRTTRSAQLASASALHQAETDRSRVETDLLALQQQNAASDLMRRQVHLPSRSIDEANDNGRLRGHARNPARLAELERQLVGKGLTRDQLLRVADMMDDNEQVSPPPHAVPSTQHALPPAWVLGLGAESASFSSGMGPPSASLFSRIQAQGFAAPDPATTPFGLLTETLAAAANGGKPPKAFTLPASYGEWVKKLREHGWSTPELHSTNPKYYWALEWVRQTVEFINFEHSWAVAGEYFTRVMAEWKNNWLSPSTLAAKEEFKCGHIRAAVKSRLLTESLTEVGQKKTSRSTTSTPYASKWVTKGTKNRVNTTDTWCACHQRFYRAGDDHHWDAKTGTGTCMVASAKSGGGKKKKK